MGTTKYSLKILQPEDHEYVRELIKKLLKPHVEEIWGWDEEWQNFHFEDRMADQTCSKELL